IDQAMQIKSKDLAHHVQVNTIAPMVLTNLLLQRATENEVTLLCANVTSGAAERPVYVCSAYCSTKASINIYTKTVALENDEMRNRNKIIVFSFGVIDNAMHEKIRVCSSVEFAVVDKFRDYKKNYILKDTDVVRGVLVDILTDETSVHNGKVYNVRDYF